MRSHLFELLESVEDEQSFLAFARALSKGRASADSDATTSDEFHDDGFNQTLAAFLEAAVAWAEDSGFGARPGPKPANPWQLAARFLWAGCAYE